MRIIPCLDVKAGRVVKGVQFKNHTVVGDIVTLAKQYCDAGADELVFYDITASSDDRIVERSWITQIADVINIPFCVAGGIRSLADATAILASGADKISINSPALENPNLIDALANRFGSQCVVVGIDSLANGDDYAVYQYTGNVSKTIHAGKSTMDWASEVADRGAGEIVLNCMNQDGVRSGYDIEQVGQLARRVNVPVIASGGAGTQAHFLDLFQRTEATGALAASVFHQNLISIPVLKGFLENEGIEVRL